MTPLLLGAAGMTTAAVAVVTLLVFRRRVSSDFDEIFTRPEPALSPARHAALGSADPSQVIVNAVEPPTGARLRPTRPLDASSEGAMFDQVAEGLQQIPPLPRALQQVLQGLQDANASSKSVSELIATEQVLSATILRVANSAAMGLRRQVLTVDDAVTYLGFSTVRSLVTRLELGKLLRAPRLDQAGYDGEKLWIHSMSVAQVADHLARRAGGVDPSLASTIGLLHDLGKVAINCQFGTSIVCLPSRTIAETAGESFLARERRLFGADHAFIGAYLALRWSLPHELAESIRLHHCVACDPAALEALMPEVRRALLVAHVANQLAKYCLVYCQDMEIDVLPASLLEELRLPTEFDKLLDERVRQVVNRVAAIGEGAAEESAPRKVA